MTTLTTSSKTAALDSALSQAEAAARGPEGVASSLGELLSLLGQLISSSERDSAQLALIRSGLEALTTALDQKSAMQTSLREHATLQETAHSLQRGVESTASGLQEVAASAAGVVVERLFDQELALLKAADQ